MNRLILRVYLFYYLLKKSINLLLMLKEKTCFIISATSDIGEAIAYKFAKAGVSILYLHGRNQFHLEKISNECSKYGSKCFIFNCDLCESSQVCKMKNQISQTMSNDKINLDIFVFCAGGLGDMDPISFLRIEQDFLKIFQLNFLSCVDLFDFLTPKFSSNSSAVFITSTNTFVPLECGSSYCTSKCAFKEFMKSKAIELGIKGIRVNSIAPGIVETKLHNQYFENKEELVNFFDKCKKEHPLGRIATCDGIANTAMFLCSDLACDITGSETVIDCGETLTIKEKAGESSYSNYSSDSNNSDE